MPVILLGPCVFREDKKALDNDTFKTNYHKFLSACISVVAQLLCFGSCVYDLMSLVSVSCGRSVSAAYGFSAELPT